MHLDNYISLRDSDCLSVINTWDATMARKGLSITAIVRDGVEILCQLQLRNT